MLPQILQVHMPTFHHRCSETAMSRSMCSPVPMDRVKNGVACQYFAGKRRAHAGA